MDYVLTWKIVLATGVTLALNVKLTVDAMVTVHVLTIQMNAFAIQAISF